MLLFCRLVDDIFLLLQLINISLFKHVCNFIHFIILEMKIMGILQIM